MKYIISLIITLSLVGCGSPTVPISGINGANGVNGANGADGSNGTDGEDGEAGTVGATGMAGANGWGCSVVQQKGGALILCGDGSSAFIKNGKNCKVKNKKKTCED